MPAVASRLALQDGSGAWARSGREAQATLSGKANVPGDDFRVQGFTWDLPGREDEGEFNYADIYDCLDAGRALGIALGIPMSRRSGAVVSANIWGKMNTLFISFLCLSAIGWPDFITTKILTYIVLATLWISSITYYIRAEPHIVTGTGAKYLLRFSIFALAIVLWVVTMKLAPGLNWG